MTRRGIPAPHSLRGMLRSATNRPSVRRARGAAVRSWWLNRDEADAPRWRCVIRAARAASAAYSLYRETEGRA